MRKFIELTRRFAAEEQGVTAIEYGMIAAGLAVGIMVTVFALGDDLDGMFTDVQTQIATR